MSLKNYIFGQQKNERQTFVIGPVAGRDIPERLNDEFPLCEDWDELGLALGLNGCND